MIGARWRKAFVATACLVLGTLIHPLAALAAGAHSDQASAGIVQALQFSGHAVVPHRKTGKVVFIGTAHGQPITLEALGAPPALSVDGKPAPQDFLNTLGSTFGLDSPSTDARLVRDRVNAGGQRSTRFRQHYQGLPVIAGELIVNLDARGQLLSMTGRAAPGLAIDTTPGIDGERARRVALSAVAKWHRLAESELTTGNPELSVYDPRLLDGGDPFPAALVWRTEVTAVGLDPVREFVLVDGHTGTIRLHFNQIHEARNRLTYDVNSGHALPGSLVCNESIATCEGKFP